MGIIKDGVFYPDGQPVINETNPNFKNWNHDRQREDHLGDIIQRYKQGKPNGEFIRQYPEEAKEQFTSQEINKFGNNYGE